MNRVSLTATDTILLHPLSMKDALPLFALTEQNRTYLRQWLPWLDDTVVLEDTARFIDFTIREAGAAGGFAFGVWHDDELVGTAGFHPINKADRSVAIGYWISEHASGKGIARAATRALIQHAFEQLGLNRVEIRCASGNIGSQKVAERCGLKFEGTMRDGEWLYDHFVDLRVYSIVAADRRFTDAPK